MPILVTCESCGRALTAPDAFRERAARCPNCSAVARLSTHPERVSEGGPQGSDERFRGEYLPTTERSAALAIASALLGAVAAVTVCFWKISLPAALLAVVLGVVALSRICHVRGSGEGLAIAGIVSGVSVSGLWMLLLVLRRLGAVALNL